jgi:hypothetical protein
VAIAAAELEEEAEQDAYDQVGAGAYPVCNCGEEKNACFQMFFKVSKFFQKVTKVQTLTIFIFSFYPTTGRWRHRARSERLGVVGSFVVLRAGG